MKQFLVELGIKQDKYVLYFDNQSAIHLMKKPSISFKDQTYWFEIPLGSVGVWKRTFMLGNDS